MNVPRTVIPEGPSVAFIMSLSAGPYFAKCFKKIDKMCDQKLQCDLSSMEELAVHNHPEMDVKAGCCS